MQKIKLKSGKNSYRVRIKDSIGRVVSKSFANSAKAEDWKVNFRAKSNIESHESFERPDMKLSEACKIWYDSIGPRCGEKTKVAYSGAVRNYIVPLLGNEKLSQLKPQHGEVFLKLINEEGRKPKTINKFLMVLKQITKFSLHEGWILKDPFARTKFLQVPEQPFAHLKLEEVNKLLSGNLNDPIYGLLMIALNTGMRLAEICGLCWDRVSFDNDLISISRILTGNGLVERTKTKRVRVVPINDNLKKYLSSLKAKATSEYVLLNSHGRPWDVSHISSRYFEQALKRAGVRKIRFHDLRHTYASLFMMSGGSIYVLQRILGHSKSDMTQRYAHLSPNYLVKEANIVSVSGETMPFQCHFEGNKNGTNSLSSVIPFRISTT